MTEDFFIWEIVMNLKAMKMFLSEENVKKHLEHFRNLRLRFSVLEKSIPELKGKDISAVSKLSISRKIKDEALELLWPIPGYVKLLHFLGLAIEITELVEGWILGVKLAIGIAVFCL